VSHDHLSDDRFETEDDEAPNGNAHEREASNTVGPAANSFEDDWVGDEAEIENAVNDADVQIPK